jgi:hypothetical protein
VFFLVACCCGLAKEPRCTGGECGTLSADTNAIANAQATYGGEFAALVEALNVRKTAVASVGHMVNQKPEVV